MLSKNDIDKSVGGTVPITDCVIKQMMLLMGTENSPSNNSTNCTVNLDYAG